MKTDMERLLEASLDIARLKREAELRAAAIYELRAELQARNNKIQLLEARLRISDLKMARRVTA